MNRNWRATAYAIAGSVLLVAALAAPSAWATPGQNGALQTIPTRTPIPAPPTDPPADTPRPPTSVAPVQPTRAPGQPPPALATATPSAGPVSGGATCLGNAALSLVASRQAVWPGATVVFTATLTNTSAQAIAGVALETLLPAGLNPVSVLNGAGSWEGQTLRVTAPSLARGKPLQAVYSARVATTQPGAAITTRVTGTTPGCPPATKSLTLALPPSQLPPTGGHLP